jgi:hypothetical protein
MPKACRHLALLAAIATLASAADRKSWNQIRYIGGTVPIKASPYDWNTTLALSANPDAIVVTIAPASVFSGHQQTLRLKPSAISAVIGPGAWQRVADVQGAQLPPKPRTLFGLLRNGPLLAILYQGDDGKPGAILLESPFTSQIADLLERVMGKPVEFTR